jgi:hypothetical protein
MVSEFSPAFLTVALPGNSRPLSDRKNAGTPRALIGRLSASITRAERMPATSIARHLRVNSLMMVQSRSSCSAGHSVASQWSGLLSPPPPQNTKHLVLGTSYRVRSPGH